MLFPGTLCYQLIYCSYVFETFDLYQLSFNNYIFVVKLSFEAMLGLFLQDLRDLKGDEMAGRNTTPMMFEMKNTLNFISFNLLLAFFSEIIYEYYYYPVKRVLPLSVFLFGNTFLNSIMIYRLQRGMDHKITYEIFWEFWYLLNCLSLPTIIA